MKPTSNQINNKSTVPGATLTEALNSLNAATGGGLDWSSLAGKPSTFPPDPHIHSIADVTNLQTILDGLSAITPSDHGNLTGLSDDDHPQYLTNSRGDARYPLKAHTHVSEDVSFTASGTGAVSTSVRSKLRETISVKDFGAVGDGVADDTAAVQLAANAASGKCLYFPPGSYKLVNGIDVTGDNTDIRGDSATIVYPQTTATYNHCIRLFGNSCKISGLRIKSPTGLVRDDTGFGISVGSVGTHTDNVIIENCIIDGIASAGIWFSNVSNVKVSKNIIINCLADGVHFADGCFDISATDNVLRENGDDNIAIVNDTVGSPYVGRFTISNNNIEGGTANSGHGIALIGAVDGVVSGNVITSTVAAGVGTYAWGDTYKTGQLLISGNKITNCGVGGTTFGGCGISLQQSNNVSIIGNHITNLAYSSTKTCGGINAASSTRLVISSNTFDDNACDQVIVTGATEAIVSGNTFGYGAREGVLMSGSVSIAVVKDNVFTATAGTNDININLPSGTVKIENNSLSKAVALTSSVSSIVRNEVESFTPTVTAQSGSITTASGSIVYQRIGRFINFYVSVSITTNGTGAGAVILSLPFTVAGGVLNGRENSLTGAQVNGIPSGSTIQIRKYDNSYPGGSGASMTLSGTLIIS
jgi:hypothetical protein